MARSSRQGRRAILIAGPTASGKSALALALARELASKEAQPALIVNADSMQVYRELRILTARPSPEDEARVPHRLYGHVSGADDYSVGRWLEDVSAVLKEAQATGAVAIIVGGTGLYFKALLEGLSPVPDIPQSVRAHWRQVARTHTGPGLHAMLRERDPEMAARLRPSDRQRLVRALEVWAATGRSLAHWQRQAGAPPLAADDCERIVLAPDRETLYSRADARLEAMVAAGAREEVAALRALGLAPDKPIMRAHGVRPLSAYLEDRLGLDEAIAHAQTETRHYIKRQFTWLRRHMADWSWRKT